jgi:hypothetical protein
MSLPYRLSVTIDETKKLLIGRVLGPMPSRILTEEFLSAYAALEKPWYYNRLIDYRRFTGTVDYADAEYFARQWAEWVKDDAHRSKVAFVTLDPLELARTSTIAHLFPHDIMKGFTSPDEALEWLEAVYSPA